jgi:hypothetical protein
MHVFMHYCFIAVIQSHSKRALDMYELTSLTCSTDFCFRLFMYKQPVSSQNGCYVFSVFVNHLFEGSIHTSRL